MHKIIHASELKEGDIFTKENKLHGRVAYRVVKTPNPGKKTIEVYDRRTDPVLTGFKNIKTINLSIQALGNVILLRQI